MNLWLKEKGKWSTYLFWEWNVFIQGCFVLKYPKGSEEKDFKRYQCIFTILLLSTLVKNMAFYLPFTKGCLKLFWYYLPLKKGSGTSSLIGIRKVILEKKIFKKSSRYFYYFAIISYEKWHSNLNPLNLINFVTLLNSKDVNIFSWSCCFYFPLERGTTFHLNKLESTLPKDALCQVWLKLDRGFWRR